MDKLIELLIAWGPTVLFILIVLGSILTGLNRGARKSLISVLHSLICFTICLTLFLTLVNSQWLDENLLDIINMIMGGEGALQRQLQVSEELTTLRGVILEYIPKSMQFQQGIELILKDNGAYLLTLVDMVYRVGFSLILYVLYLVLKFICYIIYLIFYSEGKHAKKANLAFQEGESDHRYIKYRKTGALIGLARGLIFGTLTLSLFGSIFFIAAGGTGSEKQDKIDYGDENLNLISTAYSAIGEYGTNGIFKVLNMVKDKNDTPYYLFAVDLIYQGGLKDPDKNLSENIIFRDELAAYVGFARGTYDLLLKYGKDDLLKLITNKLPSGTDPMEIIMDILSNESFQYEFDQYICRFDEKTYFINLALSLVDSMAKNIDKLEFPVTDEAKEIIQICFSKGYLSDSIPEEKALKERKESAKNNPNFREEDYELDYISPSFLITGDDFMTILRGFFDFINESKKEHNNQASMTLSLTDTLLDRVEGLSIFETKRKKDLNPVLSRLYRYIELTYLQADSHISTYNTSLTSYRDNANDIDWLGELKLLVEAAQLGIDSYGYEVEHNNETDPVKIIFNVFRETNPNYHNNMITFTKLSEILASSRVLGEVLSSSLVYQEIVDALSQSFDGIILENIQYSDTINADGSISHGELYRLVTAIRIIGEDQIILNDLYELIYGLNTEAQNQAYILELANRLNRKSPYSDDSVVSNLSNSGLIQSILSCLVIDKQVAPGVSLYIDDSLKEVNSNGEIINLIKKSEIEAFFEVVPEVLKKLSPILNGEQVEVDTVIELLKDDAIERNLEKSKVLEGIISGVAVTQLGNVGGIRIPQSLKNKEHLVTKGNELSELRKIIDIVKLDSINISELLNGMTSEQYLNLIKTITKDDLEVVLNSDILYYTVYDYLSNMNIEGGVSVVIPTTDLVKLENDTFTEIIERHVLIDTLSILPAIIPSDLANPDPNELISAVVKNKSQIISSDTIVATISLFIAENGTGLGITIPDVLVKAGKREALANKFDINPWKREIGGFVNAIDEILDVSNNGLNLDTIAEDVLGKLSTLNDLSSVYNKTKLDLLYESMLITTVLSDQLDISLENSGLFEANELDALKDYTGIYKKVESRSLVHMLKIFDINVDDLLGNNGPNALLEKINANFDNLNTKAPNGMGTNLDYLYEGDLIGTILYKTLNQNGINIPTDGLRKKDNGDQLNAVNINEARGLSELRNLFGSFDSFDLTKVNLKGINADKLSKSTIFSSVLYSNLSTQDIIIPVTSLNYKYSSNNKYINSDELLVFINLLQDDTVSDLLFDYTIDSFGNKLYDLSKVKTFNIEGVSPSLITRLGDSKILTATSIHLVAGSLDLSQFNLPKSYINDLSPDRLEGNPNNSWIANEEISKLGTALLALENSGYITGMNELNQDNIISYIDGGALLPYNGGYNIESVYDSIFIASALSNVLDTVLTPEIIDEALVNNDEVVRSKIYPELFKEEEIVNTLYGFSSIGLKVSEIIKGADFNIDIFDTSIYDGIWKSYILTGIISKRIDAVIEPLVYSNVFNRSTIKEKTNGAIRYKQEEIVNLINTLAYGLDINNLNDIANINADMLLTRNMVNIYSYNSYIIKYIINRQLDIALVDSKLVERELLNNDNVKSKDRTYYIPEELDRLLGAITNIFGSDGFDSIASGNINFDNLNEQAYNQSSILKSVITTQIDNLFIQNGFVSHRKAHDELGLLKYSEIEIFKTLVNGVLDFDVNTLSLSSIRGNLFSGTEYKSYLLAATISKALLDNRQLVVLEDDYDKSDKLITATSMALLLDGLINLGIDNISSFNINNLVLTNSSVFKDSNIINATLFKNLSFDFGTKSYPAKMETSAAVANMKDWIGRRVYLFSDSEIDALFNILGGEKITNINILSILATKRADEVCASSLIRITASFHIMPLVEAIGQLNPMVNKLIQKEVVELVELGTNRISNEATLTKESFKQVYGFVFK